MEIYLRSQPGWLESQYADTTTNIWEPYCGEIDDFIEDQTILDLDYYQFIEKVKKHINPSEILVRTYEEAVVENGVVFDFLDAISDIDEVGFTPIINPKLNLRYEDRIVQLARMVNTLPLEKKSDYRSLMSSWLPERKSTNLSQHYLSPECLEKIVKRYETSNAKIANHYFSRDTLFPKSESINHLTRDNFNDYQYSYEEVGNVLFSIGNMMESINLRNATQITTLSRQYQLETKKRKKLEKRINDIVNSKRYKLSSKLLSIVSYFRLPKKRKNHSL